MSSNRVLSAVLIAAMALIASMFIVSVSSSDAFAKVSPPAKVTVDFGAKHADLAQTVATAINENSGREGLDYYPYNGYGQLQCTVSEGVISLDFPTAAGDELVKEGHVYSYFYNIIVANGDYDQGEQLLSVAKKTIDNYTSNGEIWDEFEYAYTFNLGENLTLNVLWAKPVTKASFTVTNALCGTEVKIIDHPETPDSFGYREQTPEPNVTASEDSELILPTEEDYSENLWLNSISDFRPDDLSTYSAKCFQGTLTPETEVYVAICPMPKVGYFIDWESQMDITVNGEKAELLHLDDEIANPVVAKVIITHDWKDATCTEAKICNRCETTEGNPLGHDWKDATCTDPKKCSRCETTEGNPLGHDYGEWKKLNDAQHQKVCKHDSSHVLKENHKWDAGKVTKKATEKQAGVKTYTCTVCKATKTEVIPKLKPSAPKISGTPLVKMTAKGKNSMIIGWNRIQGAAGYDIFFAQCNHSGEKIPCKKVKTITGNKTFSWTVTGLKAKASYKAYVKAYTVKNGKKTYVRTSPLMHAYTSGSTKNFTNAKAVVVTRTSLNLQKGKTYTVKAFVEKLNKSKSIMPKHHVPYVRYMASDSKVASVNANGVITAKSKGTCYIYAYAHNGVSKSIKVTVK